MTAGPGLDALTAIDVHVHAEVSSGQRRFPGADGHPGSLVPLAG